MSKCRICTPPNWRSTSRSAVATIRPGGKVFRIFWSISCFGEPLEFPSSLAIESAFEIIGGAPNAATDAESTYYYSRVHPDSIKRGMEIFASMLMKPLLAGIEIEKRIIAEEAREDLNEQGEEVNPDTHRQPDALAPAPAGNADRRNIRKHRSN